MPELLWTNESAWCVCGHHVELHQTKNILTVGNGFIDSNIGIISEHQCNFIKKFEDVIVYSCPCEKFTPYQKLETKKKG